MLPLLRHMHPGHRTAACTEIAGVAFRVKQVAKDQHGCHGQDSPMFSLFPRHIQLRAGYYSDHSCGGRCLRAAIPSTSWYGGQPPHVIL